VILCVAFETDTLPNFRSSSNYFRKLIATDQHSKLKRPFMRITFFSLVACIAFQMSEAQNAGIGNTNPLMKLHVTSDGDSAALFENSKSLNLDVANALYFKTGSSGLPYTGALKTIGQNTTEARIGLFTNASTAANGLLERFSILNNGRVGVNNTGPLLTAMFNVKAIDNTSSNFAFDVTNSSNGPLLRVRNDGHIGIGVSNPNFPLQLTTSESIGANISSSDGAAGTGIVASGNNIVGGTLVAGSGAAFTGLSTGAYIKTTTGSASQSIYSDNFGNVVRLNYWNGTTQFKINGAGAVSTIVSGLNNEKVTMYAPEAPEIFFQDYGQGNLVKGKAHIDIDPILAKNIIIDDKHSLRVFIQPEGECNGVYVTNKTATGFDVIELQNGQANTSFQWSIICNRADEDLGGGRVSRNASVRFQSAEKPAITVSVKN